MVKLLLRLPTLEDANHVNKMKSITLFYLLLCSSILFSQPRTLNSLNVAEDSTFGLDHHTELIKEIDSVIQSTQSFISSNQNLVGLMAKTRSSDQFVKVTDGMAT